jgi:hypothetical protein
MREGHERCLLAIAMMAMFGCGSSSGAPTQVVNNSGTPLLTVTVGGVAFTENLSPHDGICTTNFGCSTGFSSVPTGSNDVVVSPLDTGPSTLGRLGPFTDTSHAVNVRAVSAGYCAELWKRLNTSVHFDEDTGRVLVATTCP